MTFLELAYKTLGKARRPLSIQEIWETAGDYGYHTSLGTTGKTPIKTLAARIYIDLRDNPSTKLKQLSQRPAVFALVDVPTSFDVITKSTEKKAKYHERDLHPLLSTFVYADSHFKCFTQTIHHEKSKKGKKGENEWLHPDIVGVFFPFNDYCAPVIELISIYQ